LEFDPRVGESRSAEDTPMFFYLSKLLIGFERPGDVLLMLLVLGIVLAWFARTRRGGLVLASLAALGFVAVAQLPVGYWLTAPLEDRFPQALLPAHADGVIVLGGAVDPDTTLRRGLPTLNAEAERMTEFVVLAKRYPAARLVFSGGSGSLTPPPISEAVVARQFFAQQGVDPSRLVLEDRSRNTYENVLFSKALAKPKPGEVWLLVQSARDVPRAVGIFRQLGWPVIAVPVAYKTAGIAYSPGLAGNLDLMDNSIHEWLGLAVYRLKGWTNALFPAP
jgi:uncharacterized SAM-binding protein YcdF (DUF218 family)